MSEVTLSLFDCDECADRREELKALREENAWLRRYVVIPSCIRCKMGGGRTGYVELYGYQLPVCARCWKPGERYRLREGCEMEVVDELRVRLFLPEGLVEVECYDTDTGYGEVHWGDGRVERVKTRTWPGWAAKWRCTGAVELDEQPGAGVGTKALAIEGVLREVSRGR